MKAISDSDSGTVATARRNPPAADASPGRSPSADDGQRVPAAPSMRPKVAPGTGSPVAPEVPVRPGAPLPIGTPGGPGGEEPRPRRRRSWLSLAILLLLLAVGGWYARQHWRATQEAGTAPPAASGRLPGAASPGTTAGTPGGPPLVRVPVVAVAAQLGSLPITIEALGNVVATQTVAVKSRVAGLLERIHFKEGDRVEAGQLLAEIDPRELRVQLAQAEGQLARNRALLENARVDLRRYESLFKQDSIARQQVDTQRALVRQYEGQIRVDDAQVANARLQLGYARVTAPIGGRVGLRQVDAGNMVTGAEPNGLVVITEVEPISVVFAIPQDELRRVLDRMASGEQLAVQAFDRTQRNLLATGTLVSADNQIDPATGTIKLRAQFANTDGRLFPNQFVNARLELDTLRDVVTVPAAAIQRGSQGLFVYVVRQDRTVALRTVTLGPSDDQRLVITSGLRPGELVVIDGIDRLREGSAVDLVERPDFSAPPPKPQPAAGGPQRRRPPGGR
jgi:multidrug efflux system membrane fusion protein